jgi:hypothetical protein
VGVRKDGLPQEDCHTFHDWITRRIDVRHAVMTVCAGILAATESFASRYLDLEDSLMKGIHIATVVFVAITATSGFADLTPLSDGVPVTGISGTPGSEKFFSIEVPAARDGLDISIWGGTGDADLYVRWDALPSTTEFDYRPYRTGNNEWVLVNYPAAGEWYIMIHGYSAYAGLTLEADYTPAPAPVPVPGAVLLGMVGLGTAGLKLRQGA